jgi:L-lactate dehydrogenase complex protein LldG
VLLAPGFPAAWLPPQLSFIQDDLLPIRQLDHFDTVLTTATLGIAQTGTLVLVSGPGQGRRATTLVPDSHLCVLRARDIVETVPEAFARLISHNRSPITFVSGPSATADIEMTRIKGVHGPRFLHVILVQDVAPPLHAISRHTEAKDTRI